MRKNSFGILAMVFLVVMTAVMAGCGGGGQTTASSSPPAVMANKGTVPIDIQLFEVPGAVSTATNRAVMMVASADDITLRTKIDHVNFSFRDVFGFSTQSQTLVVKQGHLSGILSADPGTYTLLGEYMTKSDSRIYHSSTDLTIGSGLAYKITLILVMDDTTDINAVMLRPSGKYTVGTTYQVDVISEDYSGSDWQGTFDANGKLHFLATYKLKPMINQANIMISDDNQEIHSTAFTFDLLKAIDEANANGYVAFTWPAPGTVTVGGIFADDEKDYIKASIDYNNIVPTRGQIGEKIANLTLQNLTANDALIKDMDVKIWDGNYIGKNLYLKQSSVILGTCGSISTTDWDSTTYKCAVDLHIPAGATVTFTVNGDISNDYPTYESLGTDLPSITAVDASGNSIPFLQPTGNSISVSYPKG